MDEIFGFLFRITNSCLLVKYYAAFLSPKNNKIPQSAVFAAFGLIYLVFQYLSYFGAVSLLADAPLYLVSFYISVILLLVVFLLSLLIFKEDLGLQIYLLFSFFVIQEVCFYLSNSWFNFLLDVEFFISYFLFRQGFLQALEGPTSTQNMYPIFVATLEVLFYSFIYFLTIHSIIKSFSHKRQSFSLSELLYLILPCFLGFILVFIIKVMNYKTDSNGNIIDTTAVSPFAELLIPLAGVVFLACLIASVKLFQNIVDLRIEKSEGAVLRKQTQQIQEQIRSVDSIYTEIRGMRHDMKGHISNINLLIRNVVPGKEEISKELEGYIGKLGDTLNKFEFAFQTGNSISDIIIHQKYLEATDNGIDFTTDFIYPAYISLDAYDLAIILNNALENAIEACNLVSQPDRFIRLFSYTKGNMFFLEIENSFTGNVTLNELTALPVSSKEDKTVHGMGISNIRRCTGRYYGDIDIQITKAEKCNVFRLIVMLQGRK